MLTTSIHFLPLPKPPKLVVLSRLIDIATFPRVLPKLLELVVSPLLVQAASNPVELAGVVFEGGAVSKIYLQEDSLVEPTPNKPEEFYKVEP